MSVVAMQAVWTHSRVKGTTRLVLLCIANHTNDAGLAWPGIATLARECNMSERTVQYALAELIDAGELAAVRSAGRTRSNRYRVLLTAPETVQRAAPQKVQRAASHPRRETQRAASRETQRAASLNPKEEPSYIPLLTERERPAVPARPAPVRAVPKPNRYAEVIDAIKARGLEYEPTPRDAKAVKASALAPALIAECYEAIARGAWGREFDRDNLSVQYAISRWNAYRSSKTLPPGPGRRGEPRSAVGRELAAARQRGLIDDHGRFTEDAGAPGAEAGADLRALLDAGLRQVRDGVPLKLLG